MNQTERTSLHIEELGSNVSTMVTRRSDEGLTVTQALPFLRLQSAVRDASNGRRASIDWISVDIDGDTPRLVMELSYLAPEREEETCPSFRVTKRRRDETVPFEIQSSAPRREISVGPPAPLAPRRRSLTDQLVAAFDELRRDVGQLLRALAKRLALA